MLFKDKYSFEKRREESTRIRMKFPGKLPIIVEQVARGTLPPLDKVKFLVPADLTVGQLCYVIRSRMHLPPEKAIFLFIGNNIYPSSILLREIYSDKADTDGFLYVLYHGESTFG